MQFFGLIPLNSIILIHDIRRSDGGSWKNGAVFWSNEFLPHVLPTARILSYEHSITAWVEGSQPEPYSLSEHARDFLQRLSIFREAVLFIVLSLGHTLTYLLAG